MDRQLLINNVVALAKTGRVFGLPTVLTSIAADSFSGPLLPEVREVFPEAEVIDRSWINAWEDEAFRGAVEATGRRKLIMAGLWTEVCLTLPALSALEEGYEVYFVVDASGGASEASHDAAVQRLVQAGSAPVSWEGVLSELQRDWARQETYGPVNEIVREHGGAWGQGVEYVKAVRAGEALVG